MAILALTLAGSLILGGWTSDPLTASADDPIVIRLSSDRLRETGHYPIGAIHRIQDAVPSALTDRDLAIIKKGRRISLDTNGDGKPNKKLSLDKVTELKIEGEKGKHPVLVWHAHGYWFIASASMMSSKSGDHRVDLLDANLDGDFLGNEDFIRWNGGAFMRSGDRKWLAGEKGFLKYEMGEKRGKPALVLTELEQPDATQLQWDGIVWLNLYRNRIGIPPLSFDVERSRACQLHANYLYVNDYNFDTSPDVFLVHQELEDAPGFTKEGLDAAGHSSISALGSAIDGIREQIGTCRTRLRYLGPTEEGIGIGCEDRIKNDSAPGYTVLWAGQPEERKLRHPVLVPGAGQVGVPCHSIPEYPGIDDEPSFYDRPRGYGISFSYQPLPYTQLTIEVFQDGRTEPLKGRLFTPEKAMTSLQPTNSGSIIFIPSSPLKPKTRYEGLLRGLFDGQDFIYSWSFTTGAE